MNRQSDSKSDGGPLEPPFFDYLYESDLAWGAVRLLANAIGLIALPFVGVGWATYRLLQVLRGILSFRQALRMAVIYAISAGAFGALCWIQNPRDSLLISIAVVATLSLVSMGLLTGGYWWYMDKLFALNEVLFPD